MPLHVKRVQCLNYKAPATAAVATTNTLEVAANDARKYLLLVNASATHPMYLGIGVAAEDGKGIYLAAAGGSFEMITSNLSNEAIYAMCPAGGGSEVMTVQEAE